MVLFSRTRLSQLCIETVNRLFPARVDLEAWRTQEPVTLKGRIAPGDPRLDTVHRSFRQNLTAILRAASKASPVVIACTVPGQSARLRPVLHQLSGRRNCRPAGPRDVESGGGRRSRPPTSSTPIRLYADVIRIHPTHAEALYRAAHLALKENHTSEAAALFSRARDADDLRLRADSRLNVIIRECAEDTSVSLFDAEALFALRSPQGIPGRELFLDHIHYTFEANHVLASALLDRMEFLRAFDPEPSGPIPDVEALANNMLYNPWGHAAQVEAVINLQIHPPFRRQLDNAETIARLKAGKKHWDSRVTAISKENTRAIFARRQASRPSDAWLAARAAWYLLHADDPVRAEEAALSAYPHWPHRFEIRALLA